MVRSQFLEGAYRCAGAGVVVQRAQIGKGLAKPRYATVVMWVWPGKRPVIGTDRWVLPPCLQYFNQAVRTQQRSPGPPQILQR